MLQHVLLLYHFTPDIRFQSSTGIAKYYRELDNYPRKLRSLSHDRQSSNSNVVFPGTYMSMYYLFYIHYTKLIDGNQSVNGSKLLCLQVALLWGIYELHKARISQ